MDESVEQAKADRRAALVEAATGLRFRNPEMAGRLLADSEGDPGELAQQLAEQAPYMVEPTMNERIRWAAR